MSNLYNIDLGSDTTYISTEFFNLIKDYKRCKYLPVFNVKILGPFWKHTGLAKSFRPVISYYRDW